MALIKCTECGKEISDKAASCPNCGAPASVFNKNTAMQTNNSLKNNTAKSGFMKVCKHCKQSMPKEDAVCPHCKKKQTTSDETAILIILIVIGFLLFSMFSAGLASIKADKKTERQKTDSKEANEIETEEKIESEINLIQDLILDDEMTEFLSGGYLFITNEDLSTYCANMEGTKIYVVTNIDDIKEDRIQSTLSDGYMMSNFNISENFEKYKATLKKDDTVAIMGTVSGYTDYKFMGNSVDLKDCKVFAVGEDANNYKKDATDEGLTSYLVVTEDVANLNSDISEDDYKALCETLNYEDILRNPSNYKGKYCKLSGKVDQIIEGFLGVYIIYLSDSAGNKWECSYLYKDGESHLLEGDNVTIYGKCDGTTTSTTLLGKQVTLPSIDTEYIN